MTVHLEGPDAAVYGALDNPSLNPQAAFEVVPGAVWDSPIGRYQFRSGAITYLYRVQNHPTGCLFEGEGTLTFAPPSPIERGQLYRFCRDSVLTATFTRVYFRFFDSASTAGLDACLGRRVVAHPRRDGVIETSEARANDDLSTRLAARGWQALFDTLGASRFLYACPTLKDQNRLHFVWDDAEREPISVWQVPAGVQRRGTVDLVSSSDRPRSTPELMDRPSLVDGGFDIRRYDSEVEIAPSTVISIDTRLTVDIRRRDLTGLEFTLAPELTIDSVSVAGDNAPFVYDGDGGWMIVRTRQPFEPGDSTSVRLWYHGRNMLYRSPWGDFFISYTTRWLPVSAPFHRAMYLTTFRFPKYYDLVSCGRQLLDSVGSELRVTRWDTYEPAAFISFNYGSFDRLSIPVDSGPRLDIYRSRNHHRGIFAGDIRKDVAADIGGALRLFSQAFGPYPWDHLAATEIPGDHGQGFPQLLHLAWYSFETSEKGVTDAFRAHEVAHQWFGHLVGWETYHDQWLSEGFAEYSGALYVESRHPRREIFYNLLREWRRQILQPGGHEDWHQGPGVAPIWLGVRCASTGSPASYRNLVYFKGAYVLHMLRQMLHDFQSGSDQQFWDMMHDYVDRYAHTQASTADFQQVVEAHVGMPMDWFFNQWVYGVQIPRFEYRWQRERTADGRWVVHGQIDQFDTDSAFRNFMPITLVFDAGQWTFRQEVKGAHTIFQTPPLESKPRQVLFNDYLTILCREKVVEHP